MDVSPRALLVVVALILTVSGCQGGDGGPERGDALLPSTGTDVLTDRTHKGDEYFLALDLVRAKTEQPVTVTEVKFTQPEFAFLGASTYLFSESHATLAFVDAKEPAQYKGVHFSPLREYKLPDDEDTKGVVVKIRLLTDRPSKLGKFRVYYTVGKRRYWQDLDLGHSFTGPCLNPADTTTPRTPTLPSCATPQG